MSLWIIGGYLVLGALIGLCFVAQHKRAGGRDEVSTRVVVVRVVLLFAPGWPFLLAFALWLRLEGTPTRARLARAGLFLGHHAIGVGVLFVAVAAVFMAALPDTGALTIAAAVVIVITANWWIHQMFEHGDRMCADCAARIPDSPQGQINGKRRLLRTYHLLTVDGPIVARIGFQLTPLAICLLRTAGDVGWWLSALCYAPLLFQAVFVTVHHRLRPWCPFCKGWDDGGDHESSPTPTPSGEKVS